MQCSPLIEKMLLSALASKLPPVPLIVTQEKRSLRSPYWASCNSYSAVLRKKPQLKNVITGEGEELIAKGRQQQNSICFRGQKFITQDRISTEFIIVFCV